MRILLITPPIERPVRVTGPNRIFMQHNSAPPLGLMALSAFLKRNGFQDIAFLNGQGGARLTEPHVQGLLQGLQPDVVGITVNTWLYYDALRVAERIKRILPAVKVVMGGPHLTIYAEPTVSQDAVDFGVVGEGEQTFLDLLRALESGAHFQDIPGLVWKSENRVILNPSRPLMEPLDALPIPDHSLIDPAQYITPLDESSPTGVIMSSRGCPFHCTFCRPSYPQHRMRSPQTVVEEMLYLKSMGYRSLNFQDENFNVSKRRVLDICRLLQGSGLHLPWSFRARVDTFDEEQASAVAQAGCTRIHFGVESGTQEMLDAIHKGTTLQQAQTSFALCRKYGILTAADFILGLPGETLAMARRSMRFAAGLRPDFLMVYALFPMPGSQIYTDAIESGDFPDYLQDFARNPTPNLPLRTWETAMTGSEVARLQIESLLRFYFRPTFIIKSLRKSWGWRALYAKMALSIRMLSTGIASLRR